MSKPSDFGRVYAAGDSSHVRCLVLWSYKRDEEGCTRVGVVASKRALPKAHDRNRAKRLLREAFRNNKALFCEGNDYVLIARRAIAGQQQDAVTKEVLKALKRL